MNTLTIMITALMLILPAKPAPQRVQSERLPRHDQSLPDLFYHQHHSSARQHFGVGSRIADRT
jgi:hypothetical protein